MSWVVEAMGSAKGSGLPSYASLSVGESGRCGMPLWVVGALVIALDMDTRSGLKL